MFSKFPSILTIDLILILGSFGFLGPNIFLTEVFLRTVLGSTHKSETLLFPVFPSTLTLFLTNFWGCFGLFGAIFGSQGKV